MAKGQSPLLGYNTNVRHKGKVFHIQTEDSGVQHPHVITHLFADGGRILKSVKTPYGELLEAGDWPTQVKAIMQDQHKAMFIALRDGQYDVLIDAGFTGPQSSMSATGAQRALSQSTAAQVAARASGAMATVPTAVPPAESVPTSASGQPATPATVNPGATGPTASTRTAAMAMPAAAAGAAPASSRPNAPPASRSGRYAPVRSPDILGSFKEKPPQQEASSIFGDGLMSEKSLDEVILAYLAEDLDDPNAKR